MTKKKPVKSTPSPAPRSASDEAARKAYPARAESAAQASTGGLKVRAIKLGYYDDKRRRIDDVFTISDPRHFSELWMERVDPRTPERLTSGNEELRRLHDETLASKTQPGQAETAEPSAFGKDVL